MHDDERETIESTPGLGADESWPRYLRRTGQCCPDYDVDRPFGSVPIVTHTPGCPEADDE